MNPSFYTLYTFTKLEISAARRLAKLGQRDVASERLRFITNSGIIPILKTHEFPGFLNVDLSLLQWELSDAMNQCQPDASMDGNLDMLSAILARLDLIAGYVACQSNRPANQNL